MTKHQSDSKEELKKEIAAAKERIVRELREREYVPEGAYPLFRMKSAIVSALRGALLSNHEDLRAEIEFPPPHIAGDFAINMFPLAREHGKPPNEAAKIAAELIGENAQGISRAAETGGYVNLTLQRPQFYDDVLASVKKLEGRYGEIGANAKKTALIEYSSPNIAKPIGVGHLRSTIIGEALARIYYATGWSIIRENYLGDWGTQFGKLIYAYRKRAGGGMPSITELKELYVRFHADAENDETMEKEARNIFAKLEAGDPDLADLWKKFRNISIEHFKETYRRFGIDFDLYSGESYFADEAQSMISEALEKGAARKEDRTEAVIVDDLPGIPSFLLRKSDGSTLYMARELASLKFRIEEFKPEEIMDIVGQEQELHFRQIFALAKKMGILKEPADAKHIGFGTVLVDGKKMSTRKGTLVELDDLLSQSVEKSRAIVKEKNPDLPENDLDAIAEIVGTGAIIYNDLRQGRMRNISFDWARMLDFEGGSAAYLQYTAVRINSIMRKVDELGLKADAHNFIFEKDSEFALAKKIAFFPKIILAAQNEDAPHLIATYLEELAQLFNAFYGEVSIIKTEELELRASRLALVEAVALVIENGLGLLNIKVPEKM